MRRLPATMRWQVGDLANSPAASTTLSLRQASFDLRTGVIWMAVAAAVGQGAIFLAGVLIANTVGTRQFGTYGFLQGTLTNWSLVASMSSGLLATRYLAAYGRSDAARAGQVLGYCTIVTASAGCLAGIVLWSARMSLVRNVDDAVAMISGLSSVSIGTKSRAMRRSTCGSENRRNLSM